MFQDEEDRLDNRQTVIHAIVVMSVVLFVECIELTMFDHQADASVPEFAPERVSVVALASENRVQLV